MKTLLISFLLSASCWAAQTRISAATGFNHSAATFVPTTPGFTATSGDAIFCMVNGQASDVVSSVTSFLGNTFTASTLYASSVNTIQWWYSLNIIGGANEVLTANFTTSSTYRAITCTVVRGIPSAGSVDVNVGGAAASGNSCSAGPFSTSQASEVVVIGIAPGAGGVSFTAGSGYTWDGVSPNDFYLTEYQVFSSPSGPVSGSISFTGGAVVSVCGAFGMKDTSAAPTRHRLRVNQY